MPRIDGDNKPEPEVREQRPSGGSDYFLVTM
jgi:hypothetical protein